MEKLHYTVTPYDLKGHRFLVSLYIDGRTTAGQVFKMPAWIPGSYMIRDFSKNIETISAQDKHGNIALTQTDKQTWVLQQSAENLTLSICVYAWDQSVRTAHLDETHGFFNGTSLFLYPEDQTHLPCLLTLNPPEEYPNWQVFTSLPEAPMELNGAQRHGFGNYLAPNYDALIDHPVEMGTPIHTHFYAHGYEHELVFTGYAPNLDIERLRVDIQKICETQIAFFDPTERKAPFIDSATRYVFLTHVTSNGYGGLEHRASTALICSRRDLPTQGNTHNDELYHSYLGLVSHEYFHTWNVKRIKPTEFVPYKLEEESYTELLWIFEGFTSYYDDLLLWRAGCIDRSSYLKLLSKTITQVLRTPGRHKQTLAESSFSAWHKYYKQDENAINAIVSYYTKGALMAFAIDLKIKEQSQQQHSLDDVMRTLWTRYGEGFYSKHTQKGITLNNLLECIQTSTGLNLGNFINQYTQTTIDLPLEQLCQENQLKLTLADENKRILPIDIGLQTQAGTSIIKQVAELSPAYNAGLAAHDTLVALNNLCITNDKKLNEVLSTLQSTQTYSLHYFRDDVLHTTHLTLEASGAQSYYLEDI